MYDNLQVCFRFITRIGSLPGSRQGFNPHKKRSKIFQVSFTEYVNLHSALLSYTPLKLRRLYVVEPYSLNYDYLVGGQLLPNIGGIW